MDAHTWTVAFTNTVYALSTQAVTLCVAARANLTLKVCLAFGVAAAQGASLFSLLPVEQAKLRQAVGISATAGFIRAETLAHIVFIKGAERFLFCSVF